MPILDFGPVGGGGTPGGSDTQIQFNDAGAFGGSANLTWAGGVLGLTGSFTFSGDTTLTRGAAAGLIKLTAATTTNTLAVQNGANLEIGSIGWSGNNFRMGTLGGVSGGTARDVVIGSALGAPNGIYFATEDTSRWQIASTGLLRPVADAAYDIGDATHQVRRLYLSDFTGATHSHLNAAGGGTITAAAISDLATAAVAFSNKTGNISQWTNNVGYLTSVLDILGNAGTATALQTARAINGVSFNGTADITVTAAAGTLSGATLAAGVTASSLTSFGASPTLTTPTIASFVNATHTHLNAAGGGTLTAAAITPPGSTTQVLFNDASAFGADAGLTYDKATDILQARTRIDIKTTGAPGAYLTSQGLFFLDNAGGEILRLVGTDPDTANDFNSGNLYLGYQAGLNQPTDNVSAGYFNVGIGSNALKAITTGAFNVALGVNALDVLTTGDSNMALGADAGGGITTGSSNTFIGNTAGQTITTGTQNTAIGYGTGPTTGALANTLALGYGTTVSASNRAVIGNASVTDVYFGSESATAVLHGVLTSCTGLPISTGVSGLGTNVATFLATPSSANLIAALTDETGTGACVFANTPTLVTPVLGVATATSLNGNTFTAGTYTLTGVAGKTLTFNKSLTLEGTDATTMTFPTTSATMARTDAAQTFTGSQTIAALVGPVTITEAVGSSGLTITGATQVASFPVLSATQTWNGSAVVFTGWKLNITNTLSSNNSLPLDIQVGGSSILALKVTGAITAGITGDGSLNAFTIGATKLRVTTGATLEGISTGLTVCSTSTLGFSSTSSNATASPDAFFMRGGAAATIQMGADVNGAAVSQTLTAANGITGNDRTGGNLTVASGKGSGGGAVSSLIFQTPTVGTGGTGTAQALATRLTIDSAGAVFTGRITALGGAVFLVTSSALTDGVGAGAGTILNAPAAGNPTKWIGINDNGTVRYIPAW